MELDEYFFRRKRKQKEFAEKIGCAAHTLNQIIHHKQTPNLLFALKIYYEANGEVPLAHMLKPEDLEELKKMYGVVKKESIYQDDKRLECPIIDLTAGRRND